MNRRSPVKRGVGTRPAVRVARNPDGGRLRGVGRSPRRQVIPDVKLHKTVVEIRLDHDKLIALDPALRDGGQWRKPG